MPALVSNPASKDADLRECSDVRAMPVSIDFTALPKTREPKHAPSQSDFQYWTNPHKKLDMLDVKPRFQHMCSWMV